MQIKNQLYLLATVLLLSCEKNGGNENKIITYPVMAEARHPKVLTTVQGITLYNGGYGSSLVQDPKEKDVFYLLTDRGPNVVEASTNSIMIATPDFVPQIGKFRLQGDSLVLETTILLKNSAGANLNGIPNPVGAGNSGETPTDINGNILPLSADGLDSEGLAIAPDGSFWVSDEYGPHLVHFDKTGRTKEFVYMMDKLGLQAVSEIAAIDSQTFLVLERDGKMATAATKGDVFKKIFKISLAGATDIADPANGANGKLFGGKTVEELKDAATLAANGIIPVTKTLVIDMMTDMEVLYPYEKAEGLAIISPNMIAISNDDDFGITGADKVYKQKTVTATGKVEKNSIYFIKLKKPFY